MSLKRLLLLNTFFQLFLRFLLFFKLLLSVWTLLKKRFEKKV